MNLQEDLQKGDKSGNAAPPDRALCPPDETVRAVAQNEMQPDADFREHLESCPYCRREFVDHQAQLEWNRMYKKTSWLLYLVLFVILCRIIYDACQSSH